MLHAARKNFLRSCTILILSSLSVAQATPVAGYSVPASGTGLTVFIGPGVSTTPGGVVVTWQGGLITVNALIKTYIYLDNTGTIQTSTIGFGAGSVPLATTTADFNHVLTVQDVRATYNFNASGSNGAPFLIRTNSPNGTTLNQLVTYDTGNLDSGGVATVQNAAVGSKAVIGICIAGCGTSGSATIGTYLSAQCLSDNQTHIGDLVTASSTSAGQCDDYGAAVSSTVQTVGRISKANTGAGTNSQIDFSTIDLLSPGSSGGSGSVNNSTCAARVAYYSGIGTVVGSDCSFSTDGNGNVGVTSLSVKGSGTGVVTWGEGATPTSPAGGNTSLFANTNHDLNCLGPTGTTCGANLPRLNKTLMIDGVTYPYTAAGIQSALNAVAASSADGIGGTVMLPAQLINLSSTGLTIPNGVTLACESGKNACQLGFSGTTAITIGANTGTGVFHGGVRNVFIIDTAPVSGDTGILIQGFAAQPTQHETIEDNTIWFNYPTRNSVTAGTTGINVTSANVGNAALLYINKNNIVNAAQPQIITKGEQIWSEQNKIDWFTAPAVSIVNSLLIKWTGRIAGNGNTGSAVNIDVNSLKNHFEVFCDSGSAQCFNEAGNSNYLEGYAAGGSGITQGTFAANDTSTLLWEGQTTSNIFTWTCTIAPNIFNTTTGSWCQWTTPIAITVKRIEALSDVSGAGCSVTPIIQFTNGSSADNLSLVNGTSAADSGVITGNFNAGKYTISVTGGTGCTSPWQYTTVTVQYVPQGAA